MMKYLKLSKFEFINIGIFTLLIFILGLILPIFYGDDINYAIDQGSFIVQQIQEYKTWHGRFLTHIWVRIILQYPYTSDLLISFFVALFFYASWKSINPHHTASEKNNQRVLLVVLCFALILFFTHGFWIAMLRVTHFLSYRFTVALVLLFLIPYLKIFANKEDKPSLKIFIPLSFLAGATHEQVVIVIPLLLMMGIIGKFLKKNIPLWYWLGIIVFVIGCATVFLSPAGLSEEKIITYGNALEWDFFGQTLNWLELGWKRYFYSLIKVLSIWIPHSIGFMIFFIILLILSIKKLNSFSYELVPSIFLFLLSQAIILVMMFSPRFTSGPMALGSDLIVISCISLLSSYWKIIKFDVRTKEKLIMKIVYSITFITWILQIPPVLSYRVEYNHMIKIVGQAIKKGDSEIIIPKLKRQGIKTLFGYIRIIHPPEVNTLIKYKYPNTTITIIEK
ncbi:MAG: hypothetical protein KFW21_00440 [Spirochaetota bacterium]|nr:hypothetical protein [Spirochaetota bacterium]